MPCQIPDTVATGDETVEFNSCNERYARNLKAKGIFKLITFFNWFNEMHSDWWRAPLVKHQLEKPLKEPSHSLFLHCYIRRSWIFSLYNSQCNGKIFLPASQMDKAVQRGIDKIYKFLSFKIHIVIY